MLYYFFKVAISAILIVIISEISKSSSLVGGILASIPLLSILAFIWLYVDTKDTQKVIDLSQSIFWLVIPSLSLFILFPILLKQNIHFALALVLSILGMLVFYYLMIFLLNKTGVNL